MVAGHAYWVVIWIGILLLGLLGFGASIYWGRETRWKNLDEFLRAVDGGRWPDERAADTLAKYELLARALASASVA